MLSRRTSRTARLFLPWLIVLICSIPALAQGSQRTIHVRMAETDVRLEAASLDRIAATPGVLAARRVVPDAAVPRALELARWTRVTVDSDSDIQATLETLQGMPGVDFAEVTPVRTVTGLPGGATGIANLPNDPMVSFQWHLNAVNAFAAWEESGGADGAVIAILDNGVDLNHPDLRNALWVNPGEDGGNAGFDDDGNGYTDDLHGWDAFAWDGDPDAPEDVQSPSHGTHCAGIAAATSNNGSGVSGVAPGARIMAVRIGEGRQIYNTVDGVIYAALNGADVISMSFAGYIESVFERDVMAFAKEQGCVLLAASGNEGTSQLSYPAAYEDVIGVGATDIDNELASFSNYGWWVQAAAPGVDIMSTVINGYGYSSGTSMACPLVAGVVAMLKAQNPNLDQAGALAYLQQGAQPKGGTTPFFTPVGVVDAWRSVLADRPALLIHDVLLDSDNDGDGRLERGEFANAMFDVELIGPASDYVVSLGGGALNSHVEINGSYLNAAASPGRFTIGGFTVQAANNALRGEQPVALLVDVNGYADTLSVRIPIDPPWITVSTEGMVASVGDYGAIGYRDYLQNTDQPDGVRLKNQPVGMLFHGSVMVADPVGGVADNAYGTVNQDQHDFEVTSNEGWTTLAESNGQQRYRSTFTDAFHSTVPVGVVVTQTVRADPSGPDIVYIDYNVRTSSGTRDLLVGIYCDWDIVNLGSNVVRYNEGLRLSYIEGGQGFAGVVALGTRPISGVRAFNNNTVLFDGFSDAEKRTAMSGGDDQAVSGSPADVSHLIAQYVEDVGAVGTKQVQFALIAAETETDLIALATAAHGSSQPSGGGGTGDELDATFPSFSLSSAWPNPFNGSTELSLILNETGEVAVTVYDPLGREVRVLHRGTMAAGQHPVVWDGRNDRGHSVATGMYLIHAVSHGQEQVQKLMLVK